MPDKLIGYQKMLQGTYDEAIILLLKKYGTVGDDYFREKSYELFLSGKRKSITRGKYSRTSDGLYCHHIDEFKDLNLSNLNFIKKFRYPYEYHRKERLVYCDLFEHTILHALIINDSYINATEGDLLTGSYHGRSPGYLSHLVPNITDWFVRGKKPSKNWEMKCYNKAYLSTSETLKILNIMNEVTGDEFRYPETAVEYFEEQRILKRKKLKDRRDWIERRKLWEAEETQKYLEKERLKKIEKEKESNRRTTRKIELKKARDFNKKNIQESSYEAEIKWAKLLNETSPRDEIIDSLYHIKYHEEFNNIKEFDVSMKRFYKNELINKVSDAIRNLLR